VRVISRRRINEFCEQHADALPGLHNWYKTVRRATWRNLAELRQDFNSADVVGRRTVFNIHKNVYRLIARVNYQKQIVFVLFILTHNEYKKGKWK
jgi:mRNA interferase HigB